jgi:thiamine biosynthesis lipoprotein
VFAEVDRLMSNYRDDSELALINRRAGHGAVAVSDPMFAVLEGARRVSSASRGAFDITVGPLVRIPASSSPMAGGTGTSSTRARSSLRPRRSA